MKLYHHPPRTRQIKLSQNIKSLVINKSNEDNHPLYEPTDDDKLKYGYNDKDEYLRALIDEVTSNGYKYDLCLKCKQNDKCNHNVYDSKYSILKLVDEKMDCNRHLLMERPLTRDKMLALILYTGLISVRTLLCLYITQNHCCVTHIYIRM